MKFLVLTQCDGDRQVRYRADTIVQYWRNKEEDFTRLWLGRGTAVEMVTQTPEQIDELFAKIGAQP